MAYHIQDYPFLIPQKAPFVMLDKLLSVEARVFTSELEVSADNLFVSNGHLSVYGLIENMAQTAAAGISWPQHLEGATDAPLDGFLGGISNLELHHLPPVGAILKTVAVKQQQLGQLYLIQASVFLMDQLLIKCSLKLAGKDS